jgi:hypothetical protein
MIMLVLWCHAKNEEEYTAAQPKSRISEGVGRAWRDEDLPTKKKVELREHREPFMMEVSPKERAIEAMLAEQRFLEARKARYGAGRAVDFEVRFRHWCFGGDRQ